MATLRQRNKVYYVDYRINGRRFRKKVGSSKKIAQLALKDIEVKIARGELGFEKKDADLNKLFEEFLSYSGINHAPNTQKRYNAIVNHFKAFLSEYPFINKISHLGPKIFDDYKKWRFEQKAKGKTINMELQTFRAMFNLAKAWGYTKNNPTDNVKKMKLAKRISPRFLTKEECEKFLAVCDEWEYPIYYTFLNTGMRNGELLNLEWRDVDFSRKKIKIREKDSWSPKTNEREIPTNKGLFELLQQHKEKSDNGSLVFYNRGGKPIEKHSLRKILIKLTKRCGFPEITKVHTLRHTFASHLVMNGVDLPTVMKLMGHADVQTTMIYSHLADEHVDRAVEKLEF